MKIICDNCATKYSIADEKVQGKVFKIRCKKCQHVIVVRGEASEADGQEVAAGQADVGASADADLGDAAVWHVVIDREQVGPMTASDVRDRFAAGDINADTYCWREGYADWIRLSTVDDFADVVQATTVAPRPTEDPAEESAGSGANWPDTSQSEAPADADAGGSEEGLFAAPAASSAEVETPAASGGQLFADDEPSADERQSRAQMTGQRGENSVLFSLSNLQQLALGGKSSDEAAPAAKASGGAGAGTGSGLIDMRVMSGGASSSTADDLPLGGFAAPVAAAPVLMPTPMEERPPWLVPVLAGGGVLLLALLVTIAVLVFGGKGDDGDDGVRSNALAAATPGVAASEATPGTEAAAQPTAATADTTATEETKKPEAADKVAVAEDSAATDTPAEQPVVKKASTTRRSRRIRRRAQRRKTARASAAKSERRAAPAPKRRKSKSALDDLIDDALGPGGAKRSRSSSRSSSRSRSAAADANLPSTLGRSQIQGGMRKIKSRVQSCYDKFKVPGLANVQVKIGKNGHVSSARIKGIFSGTPTGACVTRAVKSARFPRHRGTPMSITYPFVLR